MFLDPSNVHGGDNQGSSTASSHTNEVGSSANFEPTARHHEETGGVVSLMKDSASGRVLRPVLLHDEPAVSTDSVEWSQPRHCQAPSRRVGAFLALIVVAVLVTLLVVVETTKSRSQSQQSQLSHPVMAPPTVTAQPQIVSSPRPILSAPTVEATPEPTLAITSAPTFQPAPSPGFPVCYICGNSIRKVTKPNATVPFPGEDQPIPCSQLHLGGLRGFIDPQYCPLLAAFQVPSICGCTGETSAPVPATLSPTTFSPTQQPSTVQAASRFSGILTLLLNQSISNEQDFSNRSSPQFLALHWLANEDPAQLEVSPATLDIIQKRYVMAAIYYATHGETWYESSNFLSADEICLWHDLENATGVFCNPLEMQLSTNLCKDTSL